MSLAEWLNFSVMVIRDLQNPVALMGSLLVLKALWPALNTGLVPEGIEDEEV